jgi:hypothetical protein
MSALSGLKFVTATKRVAASPTVYRRQKLVAKLAEQLACFEAQQQGDVYTAKRLQRVANTDTGTTDLVEVNRRVREWFWRGENGKLNLAVKYGAATLTLAKGGKNAIEIASPAEMVNTLKVLMTAAGNGELDDAIAEASTKTRKGFGK